MNDIDAWLQRDISPWLQANAARGIYERGPDLEEIELLGLGDGMDQRRSSPTAVDRQKDVRRQSWQFAGVRWWKICGMLSDCMKEALRFSHRT